MSIEDIALTFFDACQSLVDRHDADSKAQGYQQCGCDDCLEFRRVIKKALGE